MRERGAALLEEVDEPGAVRQAELGMHRRRAEVGVDQQGSRAQCSERTRELDRGARAAGAAFRAHDRQHHAPGTEPVREKLLREGLRCERTRGEQRNAEHFDQLAFRAQPAPA